MNNSILHFDVFSLRDGEVLQLCNEPPKCGGVWLAVMARSVSMPPGPYKTVRDIDGQSVEMAAILAARIGKSHGEWLWEQLSPPSKEFIGDFMFEQGAEKDRWYYLLLSEVSDNPIEVHINSESEPDNEAMACFGSVAKQVRDAILDRKQ